MRFTFSESTIIPILLLIIILAASAGSKALTTTAQGLLERALVITEPRR